MHPPVHMLTYDLNPNNYVTKKFFRHTTRNNTYDICTFLILFTHRNNFDKDDEKERKRKKNQE